MILRDKAHDYLMLVLYRASDMYFNNLIDFISRVSFDKAKEIIEKAKTMVDQEVPKTYRATVKKALSMIDESWWRTFENPPEWLSKAAYQYVLSETLGERSGLRIVYERLIDPREASKYLPVYLEYGVHRVVLIKPTESELAKALGTSDIKFEYAYEKNIINMVIDRHLKLDYESYTANLLGRTIYYDQESFLSLLSFLNKQKEKEQLIATASRDFVKAFEEAFGKPSSVKVIGSTSISKDSIVLEVPASNMKQPVPENVDSVTVSVSLMADSLKASGVSFKFWTTLGNTRTSIELNYPISPIVKLKDSVPAIIEKYNQARGTLLKVIEEFETARSISESCRLQDYKIIPYSRALSDGELEINFTSNGSKGDVVVKIEHGGIIKPGKHDSVSTTMKLYFQLDSRKIANVIIPNDLRYYLVGEGVDIKEIDVIRRAHEAVLKLTITPKSTSELPAQLDKAIEVTSNYLHNIRSRISSTKPLSNEDAVAIYLYAASEGTEAVPRVFSRHHSEAFMKLGSLLSNLDEVRYGKIKQDLSSSKRYENKNLLDYFDEVSSILIDSGYIRFDENGSILINCKSFSSILKQITTLSDSAIYGIENTVLRKLLYNKEQVINKIIKDTGKVPSRIVDIMVNAYLHDVDFLIKPVEGKPIFAYFSDEDKRKVAERLYAYEAVKVLTVPEYEQAFSSVRDILVKKVLESDSPEILTRYAYHVHPELFKGVSVKTLSRYDYDLTLDVDKWYCHVGRLGVENNKNKNVFILYRKDTGVGIAFVASTLREALLQAMESYDTGLKTVQLLKSSSKLLLEKKGLEYGELRVYSSNLVLPYIRSRKSDRNYYITPTGGTRLLDMLKEQGKEVEVEVENYA